jgi:hypothetical protein
MLKFTRPRGIRLALSTGVLALATAGGLTAAGVPAFASPPPTATLASTSDGPYCPTLRVNGSGFAGPGFAQVDLWYDGASAPVATYYTWITGDGYGKFEGGPIDIPTTLTRYSENWFVIVHTRGWSSYAWSNGWYCIGG